MPRVRLSAGRSVRPTFVGGRAAALEAALTAAAAPSLLPTYDMLYGSQAGQLFERLVLESGYRKADAEMWPTEAAGLGDGLPGEVFREGASAVYRLEDGTLVYVRLGYGWATVRTAGRTTEATLAAAASFRALYPATYLDGTDERVALTFWSLGQHGPVSRLRKIDVSPWEPIRRNYSGGVRDAMDALVRWPDEKPGGQLLLWQGPPGTGKTWALRALASEWASWAEFHVITDPDAFFVENASYMIDVLLAESYSAIDGPGGEVYDEQDPDGKWRVLILEDTGELLAASAKEKYGQGLSRLLNVCEGLIGQGLRVLVLVTTNDELGELNPAALRAGRCASQVVFGELDAEEASEWLGEPVEAPATLADLYARSGSGVEALEAEAVEALEAAAPDVRAEIARVAEEHAPEGGYGEASYHEARATVFWVAADWTSADELEAARGAFLGLDGVEGFESEAECAVPKGDGWEQVWPAPDSELALGRLVQLARRPL